MASSGSRPLRWPPCVVICARETTRRPRRHSTSTSPRSLSWRPAAGGVKRNVVPPKTWPPPSLSLAKPPSPPERTTRHEARVPSKNWTRMRIHCAASLRLGTETRTPTLPGAVGGSHWLIVAHGDGRNWAPAVGAAASAATPIATAPSAAPRRRRAGSDLTRSPYRARRGGVVLGIGAGRARMPGRREPARATDDVAVAAPLEGHEGAQHERRPGVGRRRERERAARLPDARRAVAEVDESRVAAAAEGTPGVVGAAQELKLQAHEELVVPVAGARHRPADADAVGMAGRVADVHRRPRCRRGRARRREREQQGGRRREGGERSAGGAAAGHASPTPLQRAGFRSRTVPCPTVAEPLAGSSARAAVRRRGRAAGDRDEVALEVTRSGGPGDEDRVAAAARERLAALRQQRALALDRDEDREATLERGDRRRGETV